MIETVDLREDVGLDDYHAVVHLTHHVQALREEAAQLVASLRGRRIFMVNSTSRGGGVAEMLPKLVTLMRELGADVEWLVMGTRQTKFFALTKRLHNLIHGMGKPDLGPEDLKLYEAVSRENADILEGRLRPEDVLVIHDPQPLGMGALLKQRLGLPAIFRCHIGLDESSPATQGAWEFLRPFAEVYDWSVFSAPEYIPEFLAGRAGILTPAIDPLGFKNRELSPQKLMGVLCNARLTVQHQPVVPLPFPEAAKRLGPSGTFGSADRDGGVGFLYRPIVTQVSRWDRLKGFKPLLEGFAQLKARLATSGSELTERHRRRLAFVRLVLAGPDPDAVADDPEGQEVLAELIDTYRSLSPALQEDIALISLPMGSRKNNELMVNAIQACSSVVVQNSLREGFGLTVTEAMWKRAAVLGSRACGIRQQIRDGMDGVLVQDPEDPAEIAVKLDRLLEDLPARARFGQHAQRRVHDEFLVFTQMRRWFELLSEHAGR